MNSKLEEVTYREYLKEYLLLVASKKEESKVKLAEIFCKTKGEGVFLCGEALSKIEERVREEKVKCVRECHGEILGVESENREREEVERKSFEELEPYISDKSRSRNKNKNKKVRQARIRAQAEGTKQTLKKRGEDRAYNSRIKQAEKKMREQ